MIAASTQFTRLHPMLQVMRESNPFYRRKLAHCGEFRDLGDFKKRAPFTFKYELIEDQHRNPPFGSNLTFPTERYSRFSQTSATSGKPMRWLDTPESWAWMVSNWVRVFEAAGVTAADRVFFAFSFGPFLGFWTAFEAATRIGCLSIPGGGMRSATRLGAILDSGATILCCTPTYALHLAEVAAQESVSLEGSHVRAIVVAGEPGGSIAATRARIEQGWPGARVVDHHGMTEIGPVSYGCPVRPNVLHVMESEFIAEVVGASGQPVAPGGSGELVLTNLGRVGSPLVRYRTGDLVQTGPAERCACGSDDLTLIGGILSRNDDMVVIRGVNVYPGAIEEVIHSCGGAAEYRVRIFEQAALLEMSIDVEPDNGTASPAELVHHIETALREGLSLRIPVTAVPRGSLPRFEMKARRWVREP